MEENKELKTVFRRIGQEEHALIEDLITNQNIPEVEAIQIAKMKHTDIEKMYIILMYPYDDSEGRTFTIKYSRREVYDYIKEVVDRIDIHKSFVLTDSDLTLEQSQEIATVYNLTKKFQETFADTSFNIEDFNDNNIREE